MTFQIRRAVPDDLKGIYALEDLTFNPDERFNHRQIKRLVSNSRADVMIIVAPAGGCAQERVIGWGAALTRMRHQNAIGRIYAVAVDPGRRGEGHGSRLTEALTAALASRGCIRIYLEVRKDNFAALGLYRGLGFSDFEDLPNYYGDGREWLRLKLELALPPNGEPPLPLLTGQLQ